MQRYKKKSKNYDEQYSKNNLLSCCRVDLLTFFAIFATIH